MLRRSKERPRYAGIRSACTSTSATSSRGIDRSPTVRSSSTPRTSCRLPPGSLRRPPGWTMVNGTPLSMRYFSALRFHSRMSPPFVEPSGKLSRPSAFSMLPGSVPPIEEQRTTWIAPAALAPSICDFWPSQSTASGWPFGKPKMGRPVDSSVSPLGAGLALVPMMRASQPASAAAMAASSVTSATVTASAGTPDLTSAALLSSLRTIPTGSNSGSASSFRKACCPVWPPAPVTATRSASSGPTRSKRDRRNIRGVCSSACGPWRV
mmetsp:Transcript_27315/g.87799  ORF Transcript_27315/g.87799 Transcript_27315/m.87799 type:complete len:266 (+) Transcript_27315:201-998(+)